MTLIEQTFSLSYQIQYLQTTLVWKRKRKQERLQSNADLMVNMTVSKILKAFEDE